MHHLAFLAIKPLKVQHIITTESAECGSNLYVGLAHAALP